MRRVGRKAVDFPQYDFILLCRAGKDEVFVKQNARAGRRGMLAQGFWSIDVERVETAGSIIAKRGEMRTSR